MRACCAGATGRDAALDKHRSVSLRGEAEGQRLKFLSRTAATWHPRHVFELRDGELGSRAGVMRAHEFGHARSNLGAHRVTDKDAVMADARTGEMKLALRRNPGAKIECGAALSRTGDVVLLAFHRHQRRPADGGEVDRPAARSQQPARQKVLDEHRINRLHVKLGGQVHHRQVLVVELAVLVGGVAVAAHQMVEHFLLRLHVSVEVHGHEPRQLQKTRVDLPPAARERHGTVVSTVRRNQSVPRFSASSLTTVGLMRVSTGPPASMSVSGTAGSPLASISAVAASTGTDGWHTANTCTSPLK